MRGPISGPRDNFLIFDRATMYFKKFTTKQVALFAYFNKAEAIEASRENRAKPRPLKNFF